MKLHKDFKPNHIIELMTGSLALVPEIKGLGLVEIQPNVKCYIPHLTDRVVELRFLTTEYGTADYYVYVDGSLLIDRAVSRECKYVVSNSRNNYGILSRLIPSLEVPDETTKHQSHSNLAKREAPLSR